VVDLLVSPAALAAVRAEHAAWTTGPTTGSTTAGEQQHDPTT
jgi:hypothetical protein